MPAKKKKDKTSDKKKEKDPPSSRGDMEASFVYSTGDSVTSQLQGEAAGRSRRTGSVPTVNFDGAGVTGVSARTSSMSARPSQSSSKGASGVSKQEISTWETLQDPQDGSEGQDNGATSGKKSKRHRPGWVKKIAQKVHSSKDSTSSLTHDLRQQPPPEMLETSFDDQAESEGSSSEDDDDTPTPKLSQKRPDVQAQEPSSPILSPSSEQDSSIFSVSSNDDTVVPKPPQFDEKDRQNSITEIVQDRAKAIQDTEEAEKHKLENIQKIIQADERLIEAAEKYKKRTTELQSQLDTERLKNEQLARDMGALQQEKQEADEALVRVCTVAPEGVEKSVKERNDLLRSENEKLAERAHKAEAAVVKLEHGMKELTEKSSKLEVELKTEYQSKLDNEKKIIETQNQSKLASESRKTTAMMATKERRHSESLTQKDRELQQLKDKMAATEKIVEKSEAEVYEVRCEAKAKDEELELKIVKFKQLQQQLDAAKAAKSKDDHYAKQLEEKQKNWEDYERKANDKERQHQAELEKVKQEAEEALGNKEAEFQSQMSAARRQWEQQFQDLQQQLETMSADAEKYKQISVEQKAVSELSRKGGASDSDFLQDVGLPSYVVHFANEVAKFVDKECAPPTDTPHAVLPHDKVQMILDVIGTDPLAKLKSYVFAVLPADNQMHSVLLDFTGQLKTSELSSLCPLSTPSDTPEVIPIPQLETGDGSERLPEESEEESNKTDMQKMEGLQIQVDHLQKLLDSTTAELSETQHRRKEAEADVKKKSSEIDEMAALIIANKPVQALEELELLRKQVEQKEKEISSLKKSVEHVPKAGALSHHDSQQMARLTEEAKHYKSEAEKMSKTLDDTQKENMYAVAQISEKEATIQRLNSELSAKDEQIKQLERRANTGSHAQDLEDEVDELNKEVDELRKDVARLVDQLKAAKSDQKKAVDVAAEKEIELEEKIEELEVELNELKTPQSDFQPELMKVSHLRQEDSVQPPDTEYGDEIQQLRGELSEKEQQLEDEIESRETMKAELSGTVRQLQAELKARDELLQLTQAVEGGTEEDAFIKVKQQYLDDHFEMIQLKEKLQKYEADQQPEALEASIPSCVRSLSHESSGLSSSAQIEQLKIALERKNRKIANLETAARGFQSTAQEHQQLKEHQTVQSKKIVELKKDLERAKENIVHLEEEKHALEGEMGAAHDKVETTKTAVEQAKLSIQAQLGHITIKAGQLHAELEEWKRKCYEAEGRNEELVEKLKIAETEGKLSLKVQLGDATAKSEKLQAEVVEWQTRCSKVEDDCKGLRVNLKETEDILKELQETVDHDIAERLQNEQDEGKKTLLQLHSSNRQLLHTNSVLENDRRRLSQKAADMTMERDQLQESNEGLRAVLKNVEEESLRNERNYKSKQCELSGKLKELDQLRKRTKELEDELEVKKLEAVTYKEDFETERREREQIASAMVEQKAKMELQYQDLKEGYDLTLKANISISEKLKKDVEQAEAKLEEVNTKHKDEMNVATAKETSFQEEIDNMKMKHEQLQAQFQQKLGAAMAEIEQLNGHISQFENELHVARQQLEEARAEVTGLKEDLAGKTQQVKQYYKQVEDLRRQDESQKREISALKRQHETQRHQIESQWNDIDNLKKRVSSLRTQIQLKLDEIQHLHQDYQDNLQIVSAQQKSDMLNAQSDLNRVLREKEQLELQLRHIEQSGYRADQEKALPVPQKSHLCSATDQVSNRPNIPGRHPQQYSANPNYPQGQYQPAAPPTTMSSQRAQTQYPAPTHTSTDDYHGTAGYQQSQAYDQYSNLPIVSNAGGPSMTVVTPQQARTQDPPQHGKQPHGGSPRQSERAHQDSLKNPLEIGITTDIHNIAAGVGEEYETESLADVPFDPNLICPMCGEQFRIGEIQKFRRHVQNCLGSSGGGNPPQ